MLSFFQNLFSPAAKYSDKIEGRPRLKSDLWPSAIYAIGDVHGCCAELEQLEAKIVVDAESFEGEKWIVLLGDYVDRGPQSANVLDRLCTAPPAGFRRICIAGNHEIMMLGFFANPSLNADWLQFGGNETLASYQIDVNEFRKASSKRRKQILVSHIPIDHILFLKTLPLSLALPDAVFVHAGIRAEIPMEAQIEDC